MHWTYGVKTVFNLLRTFSDGIGRYICAMAFKFPWLLHSTLIEPNNIMHAQLLQTFSSTQVSQILNLNFRLLMMMAILPSTHTWLSPRNPLHGIMIPFPLIFM